MLTEIGFSSEISSYFTKKEPQFNARKERLAI